MVKRAPVNVRYLWLFGEHILTRSFTVRDPARIIGRVLDEQRATFFNCLPDRRDRPQRWMSRQAGFMGLRL